MAQPSIPLKWLVIVAAILVAVMGIVWLDVAWTSRQAENANPPAPAPSAAEATGSGGTP